MEHAVEVVVKVRAGHSWVEHYLAALALAYFGQFVPAVVPAVAPAHMGHHSLACLEGAVLVVVVAELENIELALVASSTGASLDPVEY